MSTITITHNPRCSKSRQTLQLLEDNGVSATVVEYLKTGLDANTISQLINQLGFSSARQLMRKNEDEYKQLNLSDSTLTEAQLIDAMVKNPKLIERPIVFSATQARIGRPPESVLDIIQ
ncbi:arsenate reductase (glutaredoxin) [Alteromonadaceae bacterium BrNp21-10]|nr:arsenate reductase (glutaredoxin) [Alteromonadaceae bacterium BrNp21-10]